MFDNDRLCLLSFLLLLLLLVALGNVILIEVFMMWIEKPAHILHLYACGTKFTKSFSSCFIVVEEGFDRTDFCFLQVSHGFGQIAYRVQDKTRGGFFSFHREKGEKVDKALEKTRRSIGFSVNQRNIFRSDTPFEISIISKLITSRTIGKADSSILSSSDCVTNMAEIMACYGKVYLAYPLEIVFQIQGQLFIDGENMPRICRRIARLGRC